MFFFFEAVHRQNVLFVLLFSMKHLYLLTVKIAPDVNDFQNATFCLSLRLQVN